jgi:N-methylhydantoinase B
MTRDEPTAPASDIEPYLLTILSKKFEMITRDMSQALLRSARSGVINIARDFSSSITLADGRQFMIHEGQPVHLANINLTPEYTLEHFDNVSPGDCFLTNSTFAGNTHHADYTLHVPVFYEDELLFWTVNRAHQADVGAPDPSTYLSDAETIYEEGIHFPSVRIQEGYEDREDIVRICKLNIRVGETQWYGDYRAQVSAVRTGEEEIKDLCEEYGVDTIKAFADAWLDYGERMMRSEIEKLPSATIENTAYHDPLPGVTDESIYITAGLDIRPDEQRILVDLTDNIDNIPAGFNLSEATTVAAVYGGIFNNLSGDLPLNHGSVSRIDIEMVEGTIVGKPAYPVGTSTATTNFFDVLFNAVQAAFGDLGEPYGMAEGTSGIPANSSVISGVDFRRGDEPYVNEIFLIGSGGPALHGHDGWLTYGTPGAAGILYRDSVELDEQKYPILVERNEVLPDTGGPGEWRGTPGFLIEFGPRERPMTVGYYHNAAENPPRGILGGGDGSLAEVYRVGPDGERESVKTIGVIDVDPGETVLGKAPGGGGYGDPHDRDPGAVRDDVAAGIVSRDAARQTYGVALDESEGHLVVDEDATADLRDGEVDG